MISKSKSGWNLQPCLRKVEYSWNIHIQGLDKIGQKNEWGLSLPWRIKLKICKLVESRLSDKKDSIILLCINICIWTVSAKKQRGWWRELWNSNTKNRMFCCLSPTSAKRARSWLRSNSAAYESSNKWSASSFRS